MPGPKLGAYNAEGSGAHSYNSNSTKLLESVENIHQAPTLCLVLVTGATALNKRAVCSREAGILVEGDRQK